MMQPMFNTQTVLAPGYNYLNDDVLSSKGSVKSGKSIKSPRSTSQLFTSQDSFPQYQQGNSSNGYYSQNQSQSQIHLRSGSIASLTEPPSPTQSFHSSRQYAPRGMGSVAEEGGLHSSQLQSQHHNQPGTDLEGYRQCLQWLQQTCRPVFMKELTQLNHVPVPITAANARHPSLIGGTQNVQVASWKQCQVQVLPIDRWGQPQEVLQEIQALHKLRKCRQIIQLYGYLPNSSQGPTQVPALLLQQPSYGSLRQFLDHHFDSILWPERYKLALDIAQGLRFLTNQGIPCTLNSGNILVDHEGVAVLTGFSLQGGLITSAPTQMTSQPTPSQLLVYLAPEQIQGKGGYSSDWQVYSMGILLWELSSGRIPFEEIIARAETGPRLAKSMEQLTSAISKGLREETVRGTPDIYEQLFKMCWNTDAEARPPIEVIEETLQMLVVVEPMDMLMLPGEEITMPVSVVVSDSIDDTASTYTATRSNSLRSVSPVPSQGRSHSRPTTLHQAICVSNADMTEWFILSGHDINGYAIVPTFSLECEITPIQTCLGHFLPTSLPIFKELMELEADTKLLTTRSFQNCLHILLDRYLPIKNENGSAHLMTALDMLLNAGVDVNARDVQGFTPLHLLMRNPKISSEDAAEIVKKMVAKGADTSIHSPRDGNVLAIACKYLHFEAAKFILSTDFLASDPESINKAIEACMTMTGRSTDKFVNLRAKVRELLKVWTGQAGMIKREKIVLKLLQTAGQLDSAGRRIKVKQSKVPQAELTAQVKAASDFYDTHMKKKREAMLDSMVIMPTFGVLG